MKIVKDVMSTLPVWVSETASFREIAAKLLECRVSAFPVLDTHGTLTGVVSEADLLVKEAVLGEPGGVAGLLAGLVHHAERAKAGGVTAADLMTSPAVTIRPDDTVEHAAKLMYDRKVKRLPVVDQGGRVVGIISRTDILAVFDRTDAEIRETRSPGPATSRASWRCATISSTRLLPSPAAPARTSEVLPSLVGRG